MTGMEFFFFLKHIPLNNTIHHLWVCVQTTYAVDAGITRVLEGYRKHVARSCDVRVGEEGSGGGLVKKI